MLSKGSNSIAAIKSSPGIGSTDKILSGVGRLIEKSAPIQLCPLHDLFISSSFLILISMI